MEYCEVIIWHHDCALSAFNPSTIVTEDILRIVPGDQAVRRDLRRLNLSIMMNLSLMAALLRSGVLSSMIYFVDLRILAVPAITHF